MQRVLVVDDEPHIRRVIEMKLRNAGYQIRTASSAAEGSTIAREFLPHLIVSDYRMPGDMTGIDMIRELRQVAGVRTTPVILLTGSVSMLSELREELSDLPHVTPVSKPFSPRNFLELVQRLLQEVTSQERP